MVVSFMGKRFTNTGRYTPKLHNYYCLAIRRNLKSVEGHEENDQGRILSYLLSNERPQHALCHDSDNTWSKYCKAIRANN